MIDADGNELQVGDRVAYSVSQRGVPDLEIGEIIEIGEFKRTYSKGEGAKIKPTKRGSRVALRFARELVLIHKQ